MRQSAHRFSPMVWLATLALVIGLMVAGQPGDPAATASDAERLGELLDVDVDQGPQMVLAAALAQVDRGGAGLFMKIDGIDGESKDAGHEDWIDVLSWSWGANNDIGGATGQTRRRSVAVAEDFVFMKQLDKSSPKLVQSLANGSINKQIEFEITRFVEEGTSAPYLAITMEKAAITGYHVSGDVQSAPTEEVSIAFQKITFVYTEFDAQTGQALGDVSVTWDLEKGTVG